MIYKAVDHIVKIRRLRGDLNDVSVREGIQALLVARRRERRCEHYQYINPIYYNYDN